jgi:isoleucyl-tRNA synthetase
MYVKAAKTEDLILAMLTDKGRLLREEPYAHEYPFCWRCSTPLLYYAKDSWFVKMSGLRQGLLEANDTVNWIPSHLKDGRFGQWLREGKDWAFSRERYWGTPLPVWMARDKNGRLSGDPLVVGALADLEKYRADKPAFLHVMRHGEAENNVRNILDSGQGSYGLTEQGQKQAIRSARALKKKLSAKRQKVYAVIASPVQRTRETAELVAQELGIKKVIYNKELKEIELGPSLAGCHDGTYLDRYPTYRSRFEERPLKGESLHDLRARMYRVVSGIQEKYAGKHVLIVSHEYPIWMMAMTTEGWTQEQAVVEKEARDPDSFVTFAQVISLTLKNVPRDETGLIDLHRPYIDEVRLRHSKSKRILTRVPDLVDVWFDSGAMPYAQWHWPFEHTDQFEDQFPADFISEGIDQTRGWFYTLLAVSVALGKGAPYRNVLSFGHVLDEKGQKMSKSKGNVVVPAQVMDEVGVDAARWYFYTVNAPGDSKAFSMKDVRERLTRFVMTFENCVRFWELYAANSQQPTANGLDFHHGDRPAHLLDRWLLSRLHRATQEATEHMEAYDLTGAARALERFTIDELSQWWLRRSRKRRQAMGVLRHVLLELDKLLAPFIPYLAEDIHLRLHRGTVPGTESVHLHDWPVADPAYFETALEEYMSRIREFVTAGLAIRKEQGIKVRQPLASVTVPLAQLLEPDLEELLCDELNVKKALYDAASNVSLDLNISPALEREGWVREIIRTIQGMRKEAGYAFDAKVSGQWSADDRECVDTITEWTDIITDEALLERFQQMPKQGNWDVQRTFEVTPGKSLWVGIKR